jgi:hypothetical protein
MKAISSQSAIERIDFSRRWLSKWRHKLWHDIQREGDNLLIGEQFAKGIRAGVDAGLRDLRQLKHYLETLPDEIEYCEELRSGKWK